MSLLDDVRSFLADPAAYLGLVDATTYQARVETCERCPFRGPLRTCSRCGCVIALKARLTREDCPEHLWPKSRPKPEPTPSPNPCHADHE